MTVTDTSLETRLQHCDRRESIRWLAREYDGDPQVRDWTALGFASPALPQHHLVCLCGCCAAYYWAALLSDYQALDDLEDYSGDIGEEYAGSADPRGDALEDVRMRIEGHLDALDGGVGVRR